MARAVHRPRPRVNRPSAALSCRVGPSMPVPARRRRQAPAGPCSASRLPCAEAAKPHTRRATALCHGRLRRWARRSSNAWARRLCAVEVCRAGPGEVPNATPRGPRSWNFAAPSRAKRPLPRGGHGGVIHPHQCQYGRAPTRPHMGGTGVELSRAAPPDAGLWPVQRGRAVGRLGQPGPDKAVLDKARSRDAPTWRHSLAEGVIAFRVSARQILRRCTGGAPPRSPRSDRNGWLTFYRR